MNFGGCKSRFYSLKATPAIGDSKVFQVCGELTLKGQATPRRFSQTIVLSCAPPNVLYVKSNIFQVKKKRFKIILFSFTVVGRFREGEVKIHFVIIALLSSTGREWEWTINGNKDR